MPRKNTRVKSIVVAAVVGGLVVHYLMKHAKPEPMHIKNDDAEIDKPHTAAMSQAPETAPLEQSNLLAEDAVSKAPRAASPHRPPLWAFGVGVVWLLSWLTPSFLGLFHLAPTNEIQRFGNGLFLANSGGVSYFFFKDFVTTKLQKKRWPSFETSWWMFPGWHLVLVLLALMGPAFFYVSWEGDSKLVGLPFGIGVLISGLLFTYGPERIIGFDDPSLNLEHKAELRELLSLERAVEKHEALLASFPKMRELPELDFAQYLKDRERIGQLRKKWAVE